MERLPGADGGHVRKKAIVAVVTLLVGPVAAMTPKAGAAPWTNDGTNSQTELDGTATAQTWAGLWGDAPGGTAGRPYVTNLSVTVTKPDGTAQTATYVTNGTVSTAPSSTAGDITAILSPTNVCNKAKGETEQPGRCYNSPNRIGLAIAYVKAQGNVGQNFSSPTNSSGQPLSAGLLDLIKDPANTTVIDLSINMNTWGDKLRWTWLNGEPLGWSVSNMGSKDAVVRAKFKLTTGPSQMCDSGVPVNGCDPAQAARMYSSGFNPTKVLKSEGILSLDQTGVDSVFNGVLFASKNADLGSLSAQPIGSPTLGLTYAVSGMSELDGQPNVATFWAFVPDSALVNYFGATAETVASEAFPASDAMKVVRADGGTSSAPTWNRWSTDANLTNGYFLTVTDIKFDGSAVSGQGVRGAAQTATKPAKFSLGSKLRNRVNVAKSGARQRLSVYATTTVCKKSSCRWVVSSSSSKFSTATKRLATVATRKGTANATALVKATKGTLVSVMLQARVKGKWQYVTSRTVEGK